MSSSRPASPDSEHELDARGLYCPEPVMMLHNVVRRMAVGESVRVLATDPSTRRDIPKFCQFLGHELQAQSEEESGSIFIYRIIKRG